MRVTGSALHVLWGDGIGPQSGPELFAANRELFEDIAADKIAIDDLEDGVVVIDGADIEG